MTRTAGEAPLDVPATLLMNERRNRRVQVPVLSVRIDGHRHATRDWSLGGFLLDDYAGGLSAGDRFEVEGIGPGSEGPVYPLAVPAQVVRIEGERLAARFEVLPPAAFDVLESLMMRRRSYLEDTRQAGAA